MTKITIVEDDKNIREELELYLRNAGFEAMALTDFSNPAADIIAEEPDLVLLDVNLPGKTGFSICDDLRKQSEVPVIFVTSNQSPMDELNGMLRGGDDYITKPYQMPILLARITAVLKRTKRTEKAAPSQMEQKEVLLDVAAARIQKGKKIEELTKNELKILYCLFLHPGEIVSRGDLIDYLWDNEVFIDDNTLSVNMTRIRSKLEAIGAPDFIETKRGLGYRI